MITNEEAINTLISLKQYYNDKNEDSYVGFDNEDNEALDIAIKALEQQPITWIVGKDNCQVAVRNMPIDKIQKICAIIGDEEQQPKTGHWIFHKPFDNGRKNCNECIECSQCHTWLGHDCYAKTPYCPICGAKMESEK